MDHPHKKNKLILMVTISLIQKIKPRIDKEFSICCTYKAGYAVDSQAKELKRLQLGYQTLVLSLLNTLVRFDYRLPYREHYTGL